ncbi:hypothetical protein Tco_1395658 [Tanacetum coccineum]
MATPIDFSKYAMNRLKIENLTQAHLVGPVYELLKGTCTSNIKLECTSNIELEYNMKECFKALTDKLDWNNPDGDRCPFDLTKPLPLKGCPGRLTVAVEYFFNKDLEFLKSSYPKKGYTTSIMKTKSARYEIVGIEYMVPTICSTTKVGYNKDTEKGIKHWSDKHQLWYRSQLNKFSKHKVYSTQNILNVVSVNFKKMHGYGHLEEIMARRVDRQLYKFKKKSYQKKLNLTKPQMTFPGIEFKEPYTSSFNPPGAIYEDLNKQKRVMRADELYKFSDGTLKLVHDVLHHRVLNFCLGYNKDMSRRKWSAVDKRRSELMIELIDKQMLKRRIIQNLEILVGARELEMDYKLMTRTK